MGIERKLDYEGKDLAHRFRRSYEIESARGIAQDTLSNNGNKNQEMVQKAVNKMFKQWPKS